MILFYLAAWIGFLMYSVLLIIMKVGLAFMPRSRFEQNDDLLPTVSVVVAARDEEKGIGYLLECLAKQDYPRDRYKIIVVDDRSKDTTGALVREWMKRDARIEILRIRDGENTSRAPKKFALSKGIAASHGDVIVTTDADCWMGKSWLRALVSPFVDEEVQGATGVSRFVRQSDQPQPWWSEYESLEHLSYSIFAAGCIGAGHVMNAHGSNLAVRRSAFEKVRGYASNDKTVSGDDVFMLQDVAAVAGKVVFVERREGWVFSRPVDYGYQWINQRARWSSKNFYYPDFLRTLVVGISLYYLSLFLALPLALFGLLHPLTPLVLFSGRLFLEPTVMKTGAKRLNEPINLNKYMLTTVLHTYFGVFAGLKGQFFKFNWKSQDFTKRRK
ncbi:glycosyltransferase [bacterium]|nr:glycosyltransferase [bacterium]